MEAVGEITDSPLAYDAKEIDSGKKVVVNVVPAAGLKAAVRERFEAEAISATKLNHPNIPALSDFGVEDNHLIYVREDLEGTPAEEWVNAHGPMPVGAVLRIGSQVVSALAAAAVHQINHYAINPSNLVLVPGQTAEGEWPLVKVLHFVGVAPKLAGTDVAVAAFDKSLHYASPEQIQKGTVDFRSELYSLGATMGFLLTGAPPLVATAGSGAAPPATNGVAAEKMAALPKKVRRLLAQMLAVNPEERPARSPRVLQDAPGLPASGGTARDNGPQVRNSFVLTQRRHRTPACPSQSARARSPVAGQRGRRRLWSCRNTFGTNVSFAAKNRSENRSVSPKLPYPLTPAQCERKRDSCRAPRRHHCRGELKHVSLGPQRMRRRHKPSVAHCARIGESAAPAESAVAPAPPGGIRLSEQIRHPQSPQPSWRITPLLCPPLTDSRDSCVNETAGANAGESPDSEAGATAQQNAPEKTRCARCGARSRRG